MPELSVVQDKKSKLWDIVRSKTRFNYKTVWVDSKYSANSWGSRILNEMLPGNRFTYPKSIHTVISCVDAALGNRHEGIVLDYFAGSGTTAHAVMDMNRHDRGNRKYILVEMAEYFDDVLIPRIKKVAFSDKWKAGKAQKGGKGIGHFCKYYALEQYEGVLRRAKYAHADLFDDPNRDPYQQYVFMRDLKMLEALEVDAEKNKVKVDLSKLYDGIDIAETLSNLTGKWIKRITVDSVEFSDGEVMSTKDLDWKQIKPLIWW